MGRNFCYCAIFKRQLLVLWSVHVRLGVVMQKGRFPELRYSPHYNKWDDMVKGITGIWDDMVKGDDMLKGISFHNKQIYF